jgi:hypothetical protein
MSDEDTASDSSSSGCPVVGRLRPEQSRISKESGVEIYSRRRTGPGMVRLRGRQAGEALSSGP